MSVDIHIDLVVGESGKYAGQKVSIDKFVI